MSANFPTVLPKDLYERHRYKQFPTDAFVLQLNADGDGLFDIPRWLRGEVGRGIAVHAAGNAYVAGMTGSIDFPIKNALQQAIRGPQDTFVSKLNAAGTDLVYSTYVGGSRSDRATAIAVDSPAIMSQG